MGSTHVLQGMLGNNISKLGNHKTHTFLGITEVELPRCECHYPENLANYVIDLSEMTNETRNSRYIVTRWRRTVHSRMYVYRCMVRRSTYDFPPFSMALWPS